MPGFPFDIGVTGNEFPLSGNPYWSRVTISQIRGITFNNYVFLGFKPGFPLQASELNEIQEINAMNETLTHAMNHSWASKITGLNVYGPAWNGTTPLYPEYDGINTTTNLVGITGNSVHIRSGWYLVTVKSSNMKHWVYLPVGYTAGSTGAVGNELGFLVTYNTVKPAEDPSLYDNSSGTTIPTVVAPAGADRIKVVLSNPIWVMNGQTANFSPILKINTGGSLLFMNNVLVPQE